jgi:ribonuclease-3
MSENTMKPSEQSAPPAIDGRFPALDALEARLGMPVTDAQLALAALTHKSFVNEHRAEGLQDNERLEFLGDAVIDLAVSHRLMERFPGAREGDLSKIRAALVDEAALARIARELDLGALLRLGRGEELTGGRDKSSLLADAMEAVFAVLYLCGGLAPVLSLVDRFLGDAFARADAGTLDRDYKTQLQELAQSRLRASPRYRVVAEHGPDHSKIFEVELELKGEVVGRGAGRSKKDAEQGAAKLALERMNERAAEAAAAGDLAGPAVSPAPAEAPPPSLPSLLPVAESLLRDEAGSDRALLEPIALAGADAGAEVMPDPRPVTVRAKSTKPARKPAQVRPVRKTPVKAAAKARAKRKGAPGTAARKPPARRRSRKD